MKENYGFTGTIFAFGLYGALGLSFLFLLGTWLFAPMMFNDGQYGMSFMFTCPLGWLVGSLIGLIKASDDTNIAKPRNSFLIGFALIAGGCITLPILGMMFMILLLGFIGVIIEIFKR